MGSIEDLDPTLFARENLYLSIQLDDDPELLPRQPLGLVPGAFYADFAQNAVGDITPNSISVGGRRIVNEQGEWVGVPTGLRGPAGLQEKQVPKELLVRPVLRGKQWQWFARYTS